MTKMKHAKLTTLQSMTQAVIRNRYDRHYHPSNPNRMRHIVVDAAMAAAVALLVLAIVFITVVYQRAVQHQQIEITVQPRVQTINSGDAVTLHIEVQNNGGQPLRDATLSIPPAAGFTLSDAPSLSLGNISGHKTVGVDIHGLVVGAVGETVRVSAVLSYKTSLGVNGEEIATGILPVAASPITLQVNVPESLAVGKAFSYAFTIRNTSQTAAFDNILLQPTFPPDWETVTTSVASDPATSAWTFDRLGSLETIEISGLARLRAATADHVDVALRVYAAPSGTPYLQSETALRLPVFTPKVVVRTLRIPPYLTLGKTDDVVVEITNNESNEITDGLLHVHVSDALIDTAAYETGAYADGVLVMSVPTIAAHSAVTQTIALHIRDTINPQAAFGDGAVALALTTELHYAQDGQLVTVPFEERAIPFITDLSLRANARFSGAEGETIGTGPWPPRAGEPTTIWVFIQPLNRFNRVEQAVVTARLGEFVKPTGKQSVTSGDAVTIDAAGNLRWNIGALPDYKAIDSAAPSAAIELRLLAPTDDKAAAATLMSALKINGFDVAAHANVSATTDDLLAS